MGGIEILRGIAASVVVAHHLWSLSTMPRFPGYWVLEGFGSFGVNIFFVLSAFLLGPAAWSLRDGADTKRFWTRRAGRIAPAYYVNVVVLFVFFVPAGVLFSTVGLRQTIANLTFTQALFPRTTGSFGANGVLWTLTIEFLLYLSLPLIGWFFRRQPLSTFVVMLALGTGWRVLIGVAGDGLRSFYFGDLQVPAGIQSLFLARQFLGYLPLFAIGLGARWMAERHRSALSRWRPRADWWVIVVALVPAVLMLRMVERSSQFTHWVWFSTFDTMIAVLIVPALLLAAYGTTGRSRIDAVGSWLGSRSYGIYLWHFPLILVAYERGTSFAPPTLTHVGLRIGFVVALTALFAEVSFRAIEMPAQQWSRRRART